MVALKRNVGSTWRWTFSITHWLLCPSVKKLIYMCSKGLGVRRGGCIGSCLGNRREGDHWGDLGVDGWIILGWISRRWDMGIWTGLDWPRIETGGGRL